MVLPAKRQRANSAGGKRPESLGKGGKPSYRAGAALTEGEFFKPQRPARRFSAGGAATTSENEGRRGKSGSSTFPVECQVSLSWGDRLVWEASLCPAPPGAAGNRPAIDRWERRPAWVPKPRQGRKKSARVRRQLPPPPLRRSSFVPPGLWALLHPHPTLERVGYFLPPCRAGGVIPPKTAPASIFMASRVLWLACRVHFFCSAARPRAMSSPMTIRP